MYTSRENAERAYVAYLAQEDDDEYKETTDAKGLLADEQSLGETFSQKEETYNDYPEAFVLVDQLGVRVQTQYKQEYLGTLLTADTLYGVGELRDTSAVALAVPA